ncbi:suppressor of fused domain protein [Roseiconus nitratireducens]|uniref:suppressor of fused domain protein n=1 Tax=Roseiconus nitratireducens TaxID=2605748 RepID=UPI00191C50FD|nr:suppressor of fused domain protein [Roseiconus nitratireducens]
MQVEFRCPKCAKRFKTSDSNSGRTTACSRCGETIEVPYPPLEIPDEVTSGGSTVYRHEARSREFEVAIGDEQSIRRIDAHIEKYIGEVNSVWHELVSDLVHIDVHWVRPTEERPFHTLVTSGMSDRAMSPPEGAEELAYTELMVCLPSDWKLDENSLEESKNYWPIQWLKYLARFPHEYETWLFDGHTVPNGDPAEPLDPSNDFIGWLLTFPSTVPQEFIELKLSDDKSIYFLAIVPLFQNEMDYKLHKGTAKLLERFDQAGYNEVIDVGRKDVTKRRFWRF